MQIKHIKKCLYCNQKVKKSFLTFFEKNYSLYCLICHVNYYHENDILKKIDYYQKSFDLFYNIDAKEAYIFLSHRKIKILNQNFEEKSLEEIKDKIKKYILFI